MPQPPETVSVRKWIKRGIMLVNADALDYDDPEHTYNQILAQGRKPEDYGVQHPFAIAFKDKSRGELISEIVRLRQELSTISNIKRGKSWKHLSP